MIYSVEKRRNENGVQIIFHTLDGLSGLDETSWLFPYSVTRSELLATYLLRKLKWELLGKTVLLPATVMDQARRAVPALNGCQSVNINRLVLALMSRS
ncbi:hypothetical protein [Exiguobacterium sp. s154]|uniref:hypothetical protein n=1 Tax=Exiguobacterium sp. s154 TaxID=2751277 RepID=UPI001BEBD001|nr:hypothetical protein [Exiguobacterium sp. s154]